MKWRLCLYTVVLVLLPLVGQVMAQTPSRLPPDVVLDYSYDAVHLMNGAGAPLYAYDERYKQFLERLRLFPPDILIVGKEAPFTHSLGPVLSFGGENVAFPPVPNRREEEPRRLLLPEELQLRIKAIEKFVQDTHTAGVKVVLPYISPMTMFGEPTKRLGFFEFYDHWDKYAQVFDLGKRPQGDPLDWTQRDPNGNIYFRMSPDKPSYKPLRRYSMCINVPGWRQWQRLITRWITRLGYDGVWMDNALVHRCLDKYDQQLAKEIGVELTESPHRVWLESYLRYFNELRNEGARVLAVNYIEIPFQQAVADEVDLVMIEHCWLGVSRLLWWPCGLWTGFYDLKVPSLRTEGTTEARLWDNLWLVQLAYAMRGKRGTHFLYGSPAKGHTADFAHNEDSAMLALVEGAAFGGGVAVHVVGSGGSPFLDDNDLPAHQARRRFFAFAHRHQALYQGLLPAGNVAIVVFPDQEIEALLEARQVHEALLWHGILVDVLNGDTVSESLLRRYRLVIVPGQPKLPQWMTGLPLLRSPDPLTQADLRPIEEASQHRQKIPPLRRTKLSELAVQRAGGLRALALPEGSFAQASAWANSQRLVLHLLNYYVPIGRDNTGKVKAVNNIPVSLHMPNGKKVEQVQLYTPDEKQSTPLRFQQSGANLTFNVPALRVYGVCEIIFSQ